LLHLLRQIDERHPEGEQAHAVRRRPSGQDSRRRHPEQRQRGEARQERDEPQGVLTAAEQGDGGFDAEPKPDRCDLRVVELSEQLADLPIDDIARERGLVYPERAVGEVLPDAECSAEGEQSESCAPCEDGVGRSAIRERETPGGRGSRPA
jgi:hypothetical protein